MSRRTAVAIVVGLTALAAAVRFSTLDLESFTEDEAVTALLVRMSFTDMLDTLRDTESTPPLYYLVAWLWTHLFGSGEVGLRALSALAGTLTVPIVYVAGARLVNRTAGVAAAAVVSASPLLLTNSQEARAYALLVMLTALSLLFLGRWLDLDDRASKIGWAAAGILALATHYFAVFVLVPQIVVLLLRQGVRRAWAPIAAVIVAGAVLLPLALEQRSNGLSANLVAGDSLQARVVIVAKQLLAGADSPLDRPAALVTALVLAAAVALVVARGDGDLRRRAGIVGAIGACALVLPVALAVVGLDYVLPRNTLTAIPPLAIAAGAALGLIARPAVGWVVLGVTCAGLVVVHVAAIDDPASRRPDWRGLARAIGPSREPRLVVVSPNLDGWTARPPLRVYLPGATGVDGGLASTAPGFRPLVEPPPERDPSAPVVVSEIVVAALRTAAPLDPGDLPRGFALASRRRGSTYTVDTYRSRRPARVVPAGLAARSRGAAVLLQSDEAAGEVVDRS